MANNRKTKKSTKGKGLYLKPYVGRGLLNSIINNLPVNMRLPSYNYCGPGNNTERDLANNVPAKNKLDSYCKEHDIFYMKNPDIAARNQADMRLAEKAWTRVLAKDSSLAEKAAAYVVTNLMKAKSKMGMGLQFNNKKYGQLPVAKRIKRYALLSRRLSKKPIKKTKSKSKRKRNN